MCQPHFVQDGPSVLEFKELRHPYVTPRYVVFNTPNRLFERGYRHGEGVFFLDISLLETKIKNGINMFFKLGT